MKPELLAPVNLRTLTAAVQAGADAVYLGGTSFGARKFADNFEPEQLEKAVDYCHLRGVKVYLTVNILVSDSEIPEFISFVTQALNIGVDAFILQDIGMASLIKKHLPQARIHASTQLTVHNSEGAVFIKNMGFERVVTARELSFNDITDITTSSGIETEIFVHGALCMSYSGQCLMSSMIGGRSGNRGSCAQPCRLPYELINDGKWVGKGYFLSPRDLSLAGNMTDILSSGVTSLKIEGRMKGPEYVAAAVSVLRRLIDEGRNCTCTELKMLENAFSRDGFTSGMFTGDFERYINSQTGNDDIYRNRDEELLKSLKVFTEPSANLKKLPVSFETRIISDEPFELTARAEGFETTLSGTVAQKALSKATGIDIIKKQLAKTGDYPFYVSDINVQTDGQAFLPLSEINGLRRGVLEILSNDIAQSYKKNILNPGYQAKTKEKKKSVLQLAVMVTNKNQLNVARKSGVKRIFALCELNPMKNEVAVFPDIIHNKYLEKYINILENIDCEQVLTSNYALIKHAVNIGKKVINASSLNVFNSESVDFWTRYGLSEIFLSQELNIKQISRINSAAPLGAIVYGKAVMMKTAVCPVKAAMKKCGGKECRAYLKDRKNEKFPVVCNGMTTFILNSKPVYMADKLPELEKAGIATALIHFTDESQYECENIIKNFLNTSRPDIPFTRGHFYRGVT